MDGEDNSSAIVRKASQCFQNKEGCRTARKEDKLSYNAMWKDYNYKKNVWNDTFALYLKVVGSNLN